MSDHPLCVFPEEVWEMILNKLEDSRDTWNVFRAYRCLDANATIQRKKHLWLFGLVLPHLVPWQYSKYIDEATLLKCRLVCRYWAIAVDSYLENQPQLNAYNNQESPQGPKNLFWNTRTYLEKEYYLGDRFTMPTYLGGVKFDQSHLNEPKPKPIALFLKDMENTPPIRNPFLSRTLSITMPNEFREEDNEKMQLLLNDTITLHQRFGEHVWFYHIDFRNDILDPRLISECFGQLPNLRRLYISLYNDHPTPTDVDIDALIQSIDAGLPHLPHLETFRIDTSFDALRKFTITRFSSQIRRFELKIHGWGNNYPRQFPNLTELEVTVKNADDVPILRNLLMTLDAPKLAKLQLILCSGDFGVPEEIGCCTFSIEEDVFPWLKRFPNLKYFDFGEECRMVINLERGALSLSPELDSIPSLHFMAIRTSLHMNFNFLRCLPSLQYLQLYVHSEPTVLDRSTNPTVRIRRELEHADMYRSNVWEVIPKLKILTLLVEDCEDCGILAKWVFTREGYDYQVRRGLSSSSSSEGDRPLRSDIINFLNYSMRYGSGAPISSDSDNSSADSEDSDISTSDDDDDGEA